MGNAATVLNFRQMNLELEAGGSIVQPAGSSMQNVANLSGKAGTFATFDKANTIASVRPFTTSAGDFILSTAGPLTVTGPVNASTNAVALQVGGVLTENVGGAITAGTLTGSAAFATLDGANNITNLGSFTAPAGLLSLTNVSGLNISGPISTGVFGTVALHIGGALTENGGSIAAGTLTGNAGGTVTLVNTANAIGSVGTFNVVGGDLVVVNGNDLALFGTVNANNLFFEVAKGGGTLTLGRLSQGETIIAAVA